VGLATTGALTSAELIHTCLGTNGVTTVAGCDVAFDDDAREDEVVLLAVAVGDEDVGVDVADSVGAGVASESTASRSWTYCVTEGVTSQTPATASTTARMIARTRRLLATRCACRDGLGTTEAPQSEEERRREGCDSAEHPTAVVLTDGTGVGGDGDAPVLGRAAGGVLHRDDLDGLGDAGRHPGARRRCCRRRDDRGGRGGHRRRGCRGGRRDGRLGRRRRGGWRGCRALHAVVAGLERGRSRRTVSPGQGDRGRSGRDVVDVRLDLDHGPVLSSNGDVGTAVGGRDVGVHRLGVEVVHVATEGHLATVVLGVAERPEAGVTRGVLDGRRRGAGGRCRRRAGGARGAGHRDGRRRVGGGHRRRRARRRGGWRGRTGNLAAVLEDGLALCGPVHAVVVPRDALVVDVVEGGDDVAPLVLVGLHARLEHGTGVAVVTLAEHRGLVGRDGLGPVRVGLAVAPVAVRDRVVGAAAGRLSCAGDEANARGSQDSSSAECNCSPVDHHGGRLVVVHVFPLERPLFSTGVCKSRGPCKGPRCLRIASRTGTAVNTQIYSVRTGCDTGTRTRS
jgi:hypothetical protein